MCENGLQMSYRDKFEEYLRYELRRSELTVEAYTHDLRDFAASLPGIPVEEASTTDVRAWIGALSRSGISPVSLRRKVSALRTFYRFLCRLSVRKDNPAERVPAVKVPKKLPQFVKVDEMEEVLDTGATPPPSQQGRECPADTDEEVKRVRDLLIVEVFYATGMRRAELIGLNDEDINMSRLELRVLGKRNKERVIPIAGELADKLAVWQRLRDLTWKCDERPHPLFTTGRGRISKSKVYEIVKRELGETTAGRKSPHTLRHTFATAMLNSGSELNDVKALLGHATLATTQIYTHVSFAELQEAYIGAHPRANGQKEEKKGEKSQCNEQKSDTSEQKSQ